MKGSCAQIVGVHREERDHEPHTEGGGKDGKKQNREDAKIKLHGFEGLILIRFGRSRQGRMRRVQGRIGQGMLLDIPRGE